MIGQEEPLTLAGFVALMSIGIATLGFVVAQMRRSSDQHEQVNVRLTKLETRLEHHIENGKRHEKED